MSAGAGDRQQPQWIGWRRWKTGGAHKNIVLTLVEHGGSARSFHVDVHPLPTSRRSCGKTSTGKAT